jgi:hypothetical protein
VIRTIGAQHGRSENEKQPRTVYHAAKEGVTIHPERTVPDDRQGLPPFVILARRLDAVE